MSGLLEFETRACPRCAVPFDALAFWSDDAVCDKCGMDDYQAHLASINAGRPYVVEDIGGACPTQATGRTAGDRPFYFRARHGDWTLNVGEPGWPEYRNWPGDAAWNHGLVAQGDDPSGGDMDDADVLAILDEHLADR